MKENMELTREDILIESEIEVSADNPNVIKAYIGVLFNAEDKFGFDILKKPDAQTELYVMHDVTDGTVMLKGAVTTGNEKDTFAYEPTVGECEILISALKEKLREYYDCTPQEFCEMASVNRTEESYGLRRSDIVIDREMEVDCDIGQQITCYIETWFDVDEKFRIHTDSDEGTWLNMYGKYDPFADTLRIECVISGDDFSETFDYQPTAAESQLIKDMITEKIREVHGQTPQEFCEEFYGTDDLYKEHSQSDTGPTMGGM